MPPEQESQMKGAIDWSKIPWDKIAMFLQVIISLLPKQTVQQASAQLIGQSEGGSQSNSFTSHEDCCVQTLCCAVATTQAALNALHTHLQQQNGGGGEEQFSEEPVSPSEQ